MSIFRKKWRSPHLFAGRGWSKAILYYSIAVSVAWVCQKEWCVTGQEFMIGCGGVAGQSDRYNA